MTQPNRAEIQSRLTAILRDMVQDWDLDFVEPIDGHTRLVTDLGFESVDLMQLVVAIERELSTRGLPFEEILMEEGGYINEITVEQLVAFLDRALAQGVASPSV
jgi:acyl carrier protein